MRLKNIMVIGFACALLCSQPAWATPPAQKFFPLNRAKNQQGAAPAQKFFPLQRQGGMKLTFAPSKRQPVYREEVPRAEADIKQPAVAAKPLPQEEAAQLLSIYAPVD